MATLGPRILCSACLVAVGFGALTAQAPDSAAEVRALWVTRATLVTPEAIATLVKTAQSAGFNTLIVQVRGRGDAYYRSSIEPRAADLSARPDFDPLADTLRLARQSGLRVHAWVAVNLVSSAVNLPRAPGHVLRRHPEWLMVPRDLATELAGVDPRSPTYVARLARWSRSRAGDVEGLYVSPVHTGAMDHMVAVVRDLTNRYDVDGLHLDYVRYPGDEFDYSRAAMAEFERTIRPNLDVGEARRLAALARTDPLLYTRRFPLQWASFRQNRLTELVTRVGDSARSVRPSIVVSAAVIPDPQEAVTRRLQDWRTWLDRSLLDVVCPMAYTTDAVLFEQQIADAMRLARGTPVWAGIGAYRLPPAGTLSHIEAARRRQVAGIALFSYEALVSVPNGTLSLTALGRAAFGGADW